MFLSYTPVDKSLTKPQKHIITPVDMEGWKLRSGKCFIFSRRQERRPFCFLSFFLFVCLFVSFFLSFFLSFFSFFLSFFFWFGLPAKSFSFLSFLIFVLIFYMHYFPSVRIFLSTCIITMADILDLRLTIVEILLATYIPITKNEHISS